MFGGIYIKRVLIKEYSWGSFEKSPRSGKILSLPKKMSIYFVCFPERCIQSRLRKSQGRKIGNVSISNGLKNSLTKWEKMFGLVTNQKMFLVSKAGLVSLRISSFPKSLK